MLCCPLFVRSARPSGVWDSWETERVQRAFYARSSAPSRAKACLTFRYIEVGGAFRGVRFALACRTEPLLMILRPNSRFGVSIFLLPFGILRVNPAGWSCPFSCDPDKYRAEAGNAVTVMQLVSKMLAVTLLPAHWGSRWTSTDTYRAYGAYRAPRKTTWRSI